MIFSRIFQRKVSANRLELVGMTCGRLIWQCPQFTNALHYWLNFIGFGRKDVVEHLLECGASVHAKDDGGLIPLHNACSFGHAEVVQLLLRSGADANARDNWNYTPLHEAAIKGKIDVCIGEWNNFFLLTLIAWNERWKVLSNRIQNQSNTRKWNMMLSLINYFEF